MEIKKGMRFMYTKKTGSGEFYTHGKVYKSDKDGYITDNLDNKYHYWGDLTDNDGDVCFVHVQSGWAIGGIINNNINPKHYSFNIKGTPCDVFDIANAMGLNIEQSTALRYFRKKENQIEDTKKAIKCLERLVERLESERND